MRRTQDRALHYGRTKYKPGLGVCRCKVCRKAEDREAVAKHPMGGVSIGAKVEGCEYVNPEKVFADAWEKEQQGHGMPLVQRLMVVYPKDRTRGFLGLDGGRMAFWLTPRERVIVASIIQWLGTNVGFCFLQETLRKCGYLVVRDETQTDRYKDLMDRVREGEKLLKLTREEAAGARSAFSSVMQERDNLLGRLAQAAGVPVGGPDDMVRAVENLVHQLDQAVEMLGRLNLKPEPVGSTAALARFVDLDTED